jgi:hypothetical protein
MKLRRDSAGELPLTGCSGLARMWQGDCKCRRSCRRNSERHANVSSDGRCFSVFKNVTALMNKYNFKLCILLASYFTLKSKAKLSP